MTEKPPLTAVAWARKVEGWRLMPLKVNWGGIWNLAPYVSEYGVRWHLAPGIWWRWRWRATQRWTRCSWGGPASFRSVPTKQVWPNWCTTLGMMLTGAFSLKKQTVKSTTFSFCSLFSCLFGILFWSCYCGWYHGTFIEMLIEPTPQRNTKLAHTPFPSILKRKFICQV